MKNSRLNKLLALLLLVIALSYGMYRVYNWYTGRITGREMPVLELSGTPYERGVKHGKLLRDDIAGVYGKWKDNIEGISGQEADIILKEFLSTTAYRQAVEKYAPALMEEVKGLSAGSGQSFEDVFAFQLMDEFWVFLDRKFNESKHHCSGIGVPSLNGQPAYLAQNMDLENYMNGYQTVFHIPGSAAEPEQYILSCAGLIGLNGMNRDGVAVCVNTLMELNASTEALPVAFMIRSLLHRGKADSVLNFVRNTPHASGQNYIIGIRDSIYDFEASAKIVARFLPLNSKNGIVYHTNHALVNNDVKPWYADYHKNVIAGITADQNSEIRYAALESQLNTSTRVSEQGIKNILSSKNDRNNPVCRSYSPRSGFFTFSSVVFRLTGKRSMQLTYGSPDRAGYVEFAFN